MTDQQTMHVLSVAEAEGLLAKDRARLDVILAYHFEWYEKQGEGKLHYWERSEGHGDYHIRHRLPGYASAEYGEDMALFTMELWAGLPMGAAGAKWSLAKEVIETPEGYEVVRSVLGTRHPDYAEVGVSATSERDALILALARCRVIVYPEDL